MRTTRTIRASAAQSSEMLRSTCLAALLLTAGCFSEPPSTPGSNDDDDGSGSGSSTGSSTAADDEGSTTFFFDTTGSGTGSSTGTTGFDTVADTGFGESDSPPPSVIFDFYDQCDAGLWESASSSEDPAPVNCLNAPKSANDEGGGWRYPAFPARGGERALILRARPVNSGLLQVSFNTGTLDIPSGARLRVNYRFVNTATPEDELSAMTFQVRLFRPDSMPGEGFITDVQTMPVGTMGSIDVDLPIMGPQDDLVFIVFADTYRHGQGVALTDAVIFGP